MNSKKDLQKLSTEELEREVAEGKRQIGEIFDAVQKLVTKFGRITREEIHSAHIHMERVLNNFGDDDFHFKTDGAFSMFGGESVEVKYRSIMVFRVDSWESGVYKNVVFVAGEWLEKFKEVIKNQDQIAEKIKRSKEVQSTRCQKARADQRRREELLGEAEDIGFK